MGTMDVSALASLDLEELRSRLSAALDAQHALLMGDQAVEVAQSPNRRTRFTEANADQLARYITALQSAIRAKESGASGRRGPIYLGVS